MEITNEKRNFIDHGSYKTNVIKGVKKYNVKNGIATKNKSFDELKSRCKTTKKSTWTEKIKDIK